MSTWEEIEMKHLNETPETENALNHLPEFHAEACSTNADYPWWTPEMACCAGPRTKSVRYSKWHRRSGWVLLSVWTGLAILGFLQGADAAGNGDTTDAVVGFGLAVFSFVMAGHMTSRVRILRG